MTTPMKRKHLHLHILLENQTLLLVERTGDMLSQWTRIIKFILLSAKY